MNIADPRTLPFSAMGTHRPSPQDICCDTPGGLHVSALSEGRP